MPNDPTTPATFERERQRRQEQQLILLKETGPKSAAWQRARLATIWRIQQRIAHLDAENGIKPQRRKDEGI